MGSFKGKHYYIGAWGYVLYDLLYAIPVIGWIALLLHAVDNENENRRHYARSHLAKLLLIIIVLAVGAGIYYLIVGQDQFLKTYNEIYQSITQGNKGSATVPIVDFTGLQ